MKRIEQNGDLIALIIDTAADFKPGVHFISDPTWPLQIGLLAHRGGHSIPAHRHFERQNTGKTMTQEFLLVISGEMEVDFYDAEGSLFHSEALRPGQALLQIRGGHAFRFPASSQVLELKIGPYLGLDQDKQLIAQTVAKS
jgi:hypothetical protein